MIAEATELTENKAAVETGNSLYNYFSSVFIMTSEILLRSSSRYFTFFLKTAWSYLAASK